MTLRKMFLVSADEHHRGKRQIKEKPSFKKWVKILEKRKDKAHKDALKIKAKADYYKKVLPSSISQVEIKQHLQTTPTST
jgi:hypothetical protein